MKRSHILPLANSVLCVLIMVVCLSVFMTSGLGYYAARATGDSMQPTIDVDAFLILEQRTPEVGDIVHVKTEDMNYAHRLVEKEGERIVTKGDNCESVEVADVSGVSGVVVFHAPFRSFLAVVVGIVIVEASLAIFWSYRSVTMVLRRVPSPGL